MTSESISNSSLGNTQLPDPWSEYGYSNWHGPMEVRIAWLRMMGFDADEIEEQCKHCPPIDLDEELANYNAMFAIQDANER